MTIRPVKPNAATSLAKMLVTVLVILCIGEALCQYNSHHPLAGFSYLSQTNHHQTVGYSYITPTGQKVNVRFGTSAAVAQPRHYFSASPQFSAPQFVFHSFSAPVTPSLSSRLGSVSPTEFSATPAPQPYSTLQPLQAQPEVEALPRYFRPVLPAEPPRPESLFVPANGVGPVQSEKQLQAYNDYMKELAEESAKATTAASILDDFGPESALNVEGELDPEKFVIEFGEKDKSFA